MQNAECKVQNDRKRLIELIINAPKIPILINGIASGKVYQTAEHIADHLIANGVIVPPCKVGDTMYKVCTVNSRIKFGDMWDGKKVETNCDRCGYRNCHCYDIGLGKHEPDTMIDIIVPKKIHSLEFAIKIMPYVGKVWFCSREEAEKALEEVQNNV